MSSKLKVIMVLFLAPFILPTIILALYGAKYMVMIDKFLNTQSEYSEIYASKSFREYALKTFRIDNEPLKTLSKPNPITILLSKETLNVFEDHPPADYILPKRKLFSKPEQKKQTFLNKNSKKTLLAMAEDPEQLFIASEKNKKEEDPFINEWRNRQTLLNSLPIKDTQNDISFVDPNSYENLNTQDDNFRENVPSPRKTEDFLVAANEKPPTSLLNMDASHRKYMNYALIAGKVIFPEHESLMAEVSFVDQVDVQGKKEVTVISSQEIQSDNNQPNTFLLSVPIESSGFLTAKAYASVDNEKKNPLYMAILTPRPTRVSKQGIQDAVLTFIPYYKYIDQQKMIFRGKVVSEYATVKSECLQGVEVWVAETQKSVKTTQDCEGFEISNLERYQTYHLVFEKEGFPSQAFPVTTDGSRKVKTFILSPDSKFSRGYDIFLGERKAEHAVLMGMITKAGKPLSKAVVLVPHVQKIIYEKEVEQGTIMPAPELYSTSTSGRFILWNAKPGKKNVDIYIDGKFFATRTIKLFPNVIHSVVMNL